MKWSCRNLEQARAAQQKQIDTLLQEVNLLKNEMQKRDAALEQAKAAALTAQGKADQAASQATQEQQTVAEMRTDITDLKQNATNGALSLQETQKNIQASLENPLAIHYKGITSIPGGFMERMSKFIVL